MNGKLDSVFKATKIAEQKNVSGAPFPLVLSPNDVDRNYEDFKRILSEYSGELKDCLAEYGSILFRGFPIRGADEFEGCLEAARFEEMPYVGGAAPRRQVTNKRILTTNESPPSEKIPFHHEMSQVPSPPPYVFFYCEIPPESGGQTGILHSHEMYNAFFELAPEFAQKIESSGVRYIRVMPPKDDETSPIGRSWPATFQTSDKNEAENKMTEMGMDWEWLENGDLKTITKPLPAVRKDPQTGKKTFFNSMVAAYMGWQDKRNDRKKAVVMPDGSYMDDAVMTALENIMEEKAVAFEWEKGDMLWVNNNLVLHSRYPFKGERLILASIAAG